MVVPIHAQKWLFQIYQSEPRMCNTWDRLLSNTAKHDTCTATLTCKLWQSDGIWNISILLFTTPHSTLPGLVYWWDGESHHFLRTVYWYTVSSDAATTCPIWITTSLLGSRFIRASNVCDGGIQCAGQSETGSNNRNSSTLYENRGCICRYIDKMP